MADEPPATFEVQCPACRASLTVDPRARAVLAHAPPPSRGSAANLDQAMQSVKGAEGRRDTAFREAVEAEKNRADLLSRKFDVGLKRARETPDPPVRLYDYD